MKLAISVISAFLTNIAFSGVTAIWITFGIERSGSDSGSPLIVFVGLFCINGILGILTAITMRFAQAKYQKEFPAGISAIVFLFTYLPFFVFGLYLPEPQLGVLAIPLAILVVMMLFFSYMPFFHMTTQGLIHVNEFVERQEIAGKRYPKFIFMAFLGTLVLLAVWWMDRILF